MLDEDRAASDAKDVRVQGGEPEIQQSATGWKGLLKSQAKTLLVFFLALAVLTYNISPVALTGYRVEQTVKVTLVRPANLHVLLPATNPDVNLCKLLLSAAVLGYPSPVILNSSSFAGHDAHLPKIKGVVEYLKSLDATHDDDIVFIVDGHDAWLQLRPQTLIDRYFDVNVRADERIRAELGVATKTHSIRQEIIFGAQKHCSPWREEDPPCYAAPRSPLPNNIYGANTDRHSGGDVNSYVSFRQRFLNSGVAIGRLQAVRKLYGEALRLRQEQPNIDDPQALLSSLFGAQEVWRESLRQDVTNTSSTRLSGKGKDAFNPQHLDEVKAKAASLEDGTLEFGIGIDYGSEIAFNTVFADDDAEWLTFKNRSMLREAERARSPRVQKSRLRVIADDLASTLPPFWTFTTENVPRWTEWKAVPLFTNVFTGTIPVAIHHHPAGGARKAQLVAWWPLLWFQKYARLLLDAHIYAPVTPVAVGGYDWQTYRQYWPYELNKGGARDGASSDGTGGKWLPFEHLCSAHHAELFRDGLGAWQLPVNH